MRGRSGKTSPPSKAEPKAATAAANWWEEDVGELLRQSEKARRKDGPIRDEQAIFTGYPARYNYDGWGYGEYVARYLNAVKAGTHVGVRFSPMSSFSILRADHDARKGAERVIRLIEQLQTLRNEPVGQKRQELVKDIHNLLPLYADRHAVFADCGQAETGSKIEVVFQREPMDFVVVDSAKLRKAVASAMSKLNAVEGTADRFGQSRQTDQGSNTGLLKDLREFVELVDEAIERGPTAEEHRVVNYIIELARCDLLHKLRPCDCGCSCGRWLFQMNRTHTMCKACSGRGHTRNDEMRIQRNAKARQRYHLNKTRNVL